jgi:hypothetical protein
VKKERKEEPKKMKMKMNMNMKYGSNTENNIKTKSERNDKSWRCRICQWKNK